MRWELVLASPLTPPPIDPKHNLHFLLNEAGDNGDDNKDAWPGDVGTHQNVKILAVSFWTLLEHWSIGHQVSATLELWSILEQLLCDTVGMSEN